MGFKGTGDGTSTTTVTEAARIRCPISECDVLVYPVATTCDIGDIQHNVGLQSEMVAMALEDAAAGSCVMAYKIPRVVVDVTPSCIVTVGERLGYNSKNSTFTTSISVYSPVAVALESKAVKVSTCLVEFDGTGIGFHMTKASSFLIKTK